uniref:Uncharacterized protein n=1 Tax=Opuntia streptacantha TaxID=393608 RepID=A0A7C9A7D9_OPUST
MHCTSLYMCEKHWHTRNVSAAKLALRSTESNLALTPSPTLWNPSAPSSYASESGLLASTCQETPVKRPVSFLQPQLRRGTLQGRTQGAHHHPSVRSPPQFSLLPSTSGSSSGPSEPYRPHKRSSEESHYSGNGTNPSPMPEPPRLRVG